MIFSLLLSLIINPKIERKVDEGINEISENIERFNIEPGVFNYFNKKNLIIFAEEESTINFDNKKNLVNIFIFLKNNSKNELILADTAYKYHFNGSTFFKLVNGKKYKFNKDFTQFNITLFDNLDMNLTLYNKSKDILEKPIDSIDSTLLFHEGKNKDMAELFWRIIIPSSIIVLSFLSVSLTLANNSKKRIKNFLAILISILAYFVFIISIKYSIENGVISFWESIFISILIPYSFIYIINLVKKYQLKNHVIIALKNN